MKLFWEDFAAMALFGAAAWAIGFGSASPLIGLIVWRVLAR